MELIRGEPGIAHRCPNDEECQKWKFDGNHIHCANFTKISVHVSDTLAGTRLIGQTTKESISQAWELV